MIVLRFIIFLVVVFMGLLCAYFGGVELYTSGFGLSLFCSFAFGIFLALMPRSLLEDIVQ